jgi:hypothetical protein
VETNIVPVVSNTNTAHSNSNFSIGSGVCSIKSFKVKNNYINGVNWLPVDDREAEIESEECKDNCFRSLKSGSLVMHECCANYIHLHRQNAYIRSKTFDDRRIVEILSGFGKSKKTTLGWDREGYKYWIFSGSPSLFASYSSSSKKSNVFMDSNQSISDKNSIKWYIYNTIKEIGSLYYWLDVQNDNERRLRRIIALLYPNAVSVNAMADISKNIVIHQKEEKPLEFVDDKSISSDESEESIEKETDVSDDSNAEQSDVEEEKYIQPKNRLKQNIKIRQEYSQGDVVLVRSNQSHILWEAIVLESKVVSFGEEKNNFLNLRFKKWGPIYDGWYPNSEIIIAVDSKSKKSDLKKMIADSRDDFCRQNITEAPSALKTMIAYKFMKESNRHNSGANSSTISFCNSWNMVGMLRSAMLIIEAALPAGSIDETDEKWGENFVFAWREAVHASHDATSLMQCQILLEYGIRSSWMKANGLKLFSSLASRTHAMRNSTFGMVAVRIWVLDMAIRYEKVVIEDPTGLGGLLNLGPKGRPVKASISSPQISNQLAEVSDSSFAAVAKKSKSKSSKSKNW